ncbi:FMN-binding protein [Endozoicomonas lisbonensis]|uniref:Electron transport complex protein RnfG n=1 Tax=Endozoicomonas lisbonensis TaxID=3120522 RepID=A0ABV2SKN3_9GAMM
MSSSYSSSDSSSDIPLTEVAANTPAEEQAVPQTPVLAMFRTLTLTALLSGFLVVMVVQWAMPYIEANQKAATEAAVFNVVHGATTSRSFVISESGIIPVEQTDDDGFVIYGGYDASGDLKGLAVPGVASGYAGPVHIMFGYQPELEAITAYQVLTMTETPGLGDKVLTDEDFLANFDRLDARLATSGSALANDIVTVKSGTKQNAWEIDAISGATITSNAIGQAINLSAQQWLPVIHQHLDSLTLDSLMNSEASE